MAYYIDWGNQFLIFAIYAMGLNLLMGYAGQVSVAQAAFGGVGGYAAGYLSAHNDVPFLLAILIGIVIAGFIGMLVSLPALRLSQEYLVLLTLAMATIIISIATSVPTFGGSLGLQGIQVPSLLGKELLRPEDWLIPLLVFAALVYLVCWRLGESPFGRVLRGIREDEVATRSVGKNVYGYKIVTFAVAAGLAGLAGALLAYYNQIAIPSQYGFAYTMSIIAMVIIGGLGNLTGSLIGAFVIIGSQPLLEKTVHLSPDRAGLTRTMAYGIILVMVLLVRPQGILPEGVSPARSLLRRVRRGGAPPPAFADTAPPRTTPHAPKPVADAVPPTTDDSPPGGTAPGEVVVAVRGLAKSFGGIQAVRDLDLDLAEGKITGLIGPNGAGKTTVFNLLTGAIRPDEGTVSLRGRDITNWPPNRIAQHGVVRSFQDVRVFPGLSSLTNVMLGVPGQSGEKLGPLLLNPIAVRRGEVNTRAKALRWLEFVGMHEKAHEPAGSLAFGEQKLVALARLLATEADVLLLDEPASGIDGEWVDRMLELLELVRLEGKTICIVEHNLHVVERVADTIYFMEAGTVLAHGTMSELTSQEHLVEAYFGTA